MQISWTRLPFRAHSQQEFGQKLNDWLSDIFYEVLPEQGYEVREEQIYTAFRMAKALTEGKTLMAEAGPGTGKTFAYLLPAVCYARLKGAPVVVASASGVLQAQLVNPEGDIRTLSRLLGLEIDARVAADPGEYVCEMKVGRAEFLLPGRQPEGWDELKEWAQLTGSGHRSEIPEAADELWQHLAWDPALACDTCPKRGHCHVMSARRTYREAADLIVCDHKLFSMDMLTRAERLDAGLVPLLPAYSAVVLDEGQHVPETWQRAQGHVLTPSRLKATLGYMDGILDRPAAAQVLKGSRVAANTFFSGVSAATADGEGKRHVRRDQGLLEAAAALDKVLNALQEELVTAEAMSEGTELEMDIRAYQVRLDEIKAGLRLFRSDDCVTWAEGEHLWVVPRKTLSLYGKGRIPPGMPVIFSSATIEPEYQARVLGIKEFQGAKVGVPFDLGEQALVYEPDDEASDDIAQTVAVINASHGRALVLLNSMAEVRRFKAGLTAADLEYPLLFEGDGDRGAMLDRFRHEIDSVLVGATFWEGVDVPGEALSCCIIPALPYPEHDPLILERRAQAKQEGHDPFKAVDLPEMLIKLKQGAGRLIRTAQDRGVLALLDRSHVGQDWEETVNETLPEDAERTDDLARVTAFLAEGPATSA